MNAKGFTFVEAMVGTAMISIAFLSLSIMVSNATRQRIDVDLSTRATLLSRECMAIQMAKPFASVTSVAATPLGGSYSNYSCKIDVTYVDPNNPSTQVAGPNEYKKVVATITMTGWPGNISLSNLKTNY